MSETLDRSLDRTEWQYGVRETRDDVGDAKGMTAPTTAGKTAIGEAQAAAERLRELLAEGSRMRATGATDPGGAPTWRTGTSDSGLQPAPDAGSTVHPGASHAVLAALQSLRLRLKSTESNRDDIQRQLDAAKRRIDEVNPSACKNQTLLPC